MKRERKATRETLVRIMLKIFSSFHLQLIIYLSKFKTHFILLFVFNICACTPGPSGGEKGGKGDKGEKGDPGAAGSDGTNGKDADVADLTAKLIALQKDNAIKDADIADLIAKYNNIDDVCKKSDGRLLASKNSACGGAASNVDFAVSHEVVFKGISATAFNSDPIIIKSFGQSIATLLNVLETDVYNIKASSKRRQLYSSRILDASSSCM